MTTAIIPPVHLCFSDDISEQQQLIAKKKLRQHISVFLLQLIKCLNSCKREVYTLSPNLVRPNISSLREAVDNALFVVERVKRVSVKATPALKRMIQTAATVARAVYIPDSMHSTTTRSHYHSLLRTRRFLNLAMRVATVLHAFTEKLGSGDSKQIKAPSDHESGEPDAEVKNQDVWAMKLSSSKGCPKYNILTETSDSDWKPPKLIISVPLSKVSSSLVNKNVSASVLHKVQEPSSKFRASNCCRQAVLDDVVDVGVVKRKRPSSQGSGRHPEMINDLLWKVRCKVVEKQRAESRSNVLHRVQKQSVFKTTCKKKKFSPYAGRPCLKNANSDIKAEKVKYEPIKTKSPASDPQSVISKKSEELKIALDQPTQEKQRPKRKLSMDELADSFGSKCKISEPVRITYANLSFKDPQQYELTSSVTPREEYPGVAMQDGGVNFVLRASPLTQVLLCRKLEGKDFNKVNIPYFLKPATPNYNSSFLREPAVKVLKDALSQSHQTASPALHIPPHKLRKSESCQQISVDDNGVVREKIGFQQHVDCDAEVDKVSENLSKCELVEKNSVTLKWKNMTSKSYHNKRLSPYPSRPIVKKASHFSKSDQTKCITSRIQSLASDRYKHSTAAATSLSKKTESVSLSPRSINSMPSMNLPHAQSVEAKTSFSKLSNKPEELKAALNQSPQQKPQCKPMDELADLFESKCKTSDAVTRKYSNLSFRDPCQHELTNSVKRCTKHYSGLALLDGGVNFILRDSPLTEVVCKKLKEKDGLIILHQSLLGDLKPDKISEGSVNIVSGMSSKCTTAPHTVTSAAATTIRTAIDAVMKRSPSKATLKQTRRRVHPSLSNILVARKNPQSECDPASEIEEYRKIMDCDVEVSTVNKTNERFQRVRLGKVINFDCVGVSLFTMLWLYFLQRSATEACLPVPTGK